MMPLVPETKMVDVNKLISLGNLLVRKVMWLVLTTTSTTLILSRAFGADCMTRIAYIYSHLLRTHSLSHFHLQRQHTLSFSPLWLTETTHSLSLSLTFWLPAVNPTKMYTFCNLFLSDSVFLVWLLPALNIASEISTNPERDNQPTSEKTRSS